jgi:hypothetical protein
MGSLASRRDVALNKFEIGFEKADVAAHYAEVGNLLSFHPQIHGLNTNTQVSDGIPKRWWDLLCGESRSQHGSARVAVLEECFGVMHICKAWAAVLAKL